MKCLKILKDPTKCVLLFLKWSALGILVGLIGGLLGAGFHHVLYFATKIRLQFGWMVLLLPLGGLLAVAWYRLLRLRNNRGTNEIIDAVLDGQPVNPLVAPGIFVSAAITHLFGGSAGREGAALQIGGSAASALGKLLGMKGKDRSLLVMSGMSAVFAGLFATPLTACLFVLEFISVGTILSPALLPCFLSAFMASKVSGLLGVHAEGVALTQQMPINIASIWRYVLLAVAVSILGIAMCYLFHKAEHLAKHHIKNDWLRIAIGGAVITGMTVLVSHQHYNGAGMDMALQAVKGQADWYSFLLKLLFTAVTLAAGFKGGEIVPTFCIGATFGCWLGGLLGLDSGMAAALSLIGLFCYATNSPLASMVLSIEMFGATNLHLFAFICVICFALSGKSGLYSSQIQQYAKSHTKDISLRKEPVK